MSERQAKKMRKESPVVQEKKPVDKNKRLFNIVITAVIVVVAALAIYGICEVKRQERLDAIETFAEYLEDQGTTFDIAVAEWGLDTEVFSADMPADEVDMLFTLENIAKMNSMETAQLLEDFGFPADTDTQIPAKELSTEIMLTLQSQGLPITVDDLKAYGLSEDITNETPWGEARDAVYEAFQAYYNTLLEQSQAVEAEAGDDTAADTAVEGEPADTEVTE